MLTAHQVHTNKWYCSHLVLPSEKYPLHSLVEPEIRGIILPEEFKTSKNLRKDIKKGSFELCINRDFEATMRACAEREETWISDEIIDVYCGLKEMGYAYSFEVWQNNELVGGLYGVAISRIFFGESMFHRVSNTSKMALVFLMDWMTKNNFGLLDCQFITEHLKQFGAKEIPQKDYLELLKKYL